MKANRFTFWLLKIKQKYFSKKPKKIICHRCLKPINKNSIYYADYDIETNTTEYLCEECNKFFEKQMEERDRQFEKECPLHKPCCLYCEHCENRGECFYEN